MIYSQLSGGIGNMMWQAASIQALAWDNNDSVSLMAKVIPGQYAPSAGNQHGLPSHHVDNLLKNYNITANANLPTVRERAEFAYDISYTSGSMYKGYWQSVDYISNHKTRLMSEFCIDTTNAADFLDRYSLSIDNTVVVHVRRGDYINLGWSVRDDYYHDAMKHFDGLNFVFVSNDMKWCEETFPNQYYSDMKTDLDDLALINLCNKRIICNSTFSWWATYLGDTEKTVSPNHWLKIAPKSNNLLLDEWIKI